MTQLFQIVALSLNLHAAPAAAQIQPCVWPKCMKKSVKEEAMGLKEKI